MQAKCSDEDFIYYFETLGASGTAKTIGVDTRNVYDRRRRLEKKTGRSITAPEPKTGRRLSAQHPARVRFEIDTGIVLVGSDAHYWPGHVSTAHRAFVRLAKRLKPKLIVLNGDVVDGAKISRHPPMGWEDLPSVKDELDTCKERLGEIKKAAPKDCQFTWTLGNHDQRFEMKLAAAAPDYAKVDGVHLKDHFGPEWVPCWSTWINNDVVVKHRFKGGMHAPQNNTLWAGRSIITGHLHSLKVQPISDYNGTRYGVDCGTLAEPYGPQFEYTEDNPVNWRSGFIVLTFDKGRLLWPEIVAVMGPDEVEFRGEILSV